MIANMDALIVLEQNRGDAIVITTMQTGNINFGWPQVTRNERLDVPHIGGMGKASSLALGLALARPERKVIVLDGDGSLLMNLGTLVTISNKAPENLYHIVFENGVYAVTGGQPIPGAGEISFQNMAKDAGYKAAYEFDDTENLATNMGEILNEKGPVLVCLKVEPAIENTALVSRQRARRTTLNAIEELPAALG